LILKCESLLSIFAFNFKLRRYIMFLDAIEHVSRVCRVIRLPLGNALLLGRGLFSFNFQLNLSRV